MLFSLRNKRDMSDSPFARVDLVQWNDTGQNNTNDGKQAKAKVSQRARQGSSWWRWHTGGGGDELSIVLDVNRLEV